jgi:hypothetical protein
MNNPLSSSESPSAVLSPDAAFSECIAHFLRRNDDLNAIPITVHDDEGRICFGIMGRDREEPM